MPLEQIENLCAAHGPHMGDFTPSVSLTGHTQVMGGILTFSYITKIEKKPSKLINFYVYIFHHSKELHKFCSVGLVP